CRPSGRTLRSVPVGTEGRVGKPPYKAKAPAEEECGLWWCTGPEGPYLLALPGSVIGRPAQGFSAVSIFARSYECPRTNDGIRRSARLKPCSIVSATGD